MFTVDVKQQQHNDNNNHEIGILKALSLFRDSENISRTKRFVIVMSLSKILTLADLDDSFTYPAFPWIWVKVAL